MPLALLLGLSLLLSALGSSSDPLQTVVRSDEGSTVSVSTPLAQCAVCTVDGVNDTETTCGPSLTLGPGEEARLLLNCSQPPEESYAVVITRTIECTVDACVPTLVKTPPFLTQLRRSYSWELKAPKDTLVSLDILAQGLMETSQPCTDGFSYSVADGESRSRYCRGGSVTRLDLPGGAVVSLEAEPNIAGGMVLFQVSAGPLKGRTMVVSLDPDIKVEVRRDPGDPECEVCRVDGSTPKCSPTKQEVTSGGKTTLEFSCLKPQDIYNVQIARTIKCSNSPCPAVVVDPDLFADFRRSLSWDISIPGRTVLSLDFSPGGLTEISAAGSCEKDVLRFLVKTAKKDGTVKEKSYCAGGALTQLDLLAQAVVSVDVPKGGDVKAMFKVKVAPRGSRSMSVTPDPHTIIIVSRESEEPECSVCVQQGATPVCQDKFLRISEPHNTSLEFTCPDPQALFTVEINREIDCTETSCSGDIVQGAWSLFPDFNRTFTWDLKVVSTRAFQLDFPETGMRQIANEEACPDAHTYSLVTYLRRGPAKVGTFCKGGAVTTILGRYKGRVSLQVPAETKLDPVDYKLKVGPETSMIAIVKVSLPRGVSDTDFISANYAADFPDNQQMQWDFTVPGMHNYTVKFREHMAPECLSGTAGAQYLRDGKKPLATSLTDAQPAQQQGNFKMVLKNCETNTTLPGLALSYRVSVMRSGHPVVCAVDLSGSNASLQIEKVGSDPYCEISIDSKVQEKMSVAAGKKASLSFLDCPNEEVRLTASQVIGCSNVSSCPPVALTVPKLVPCLPMPLHSFTWHLDIPQDGTVDLRSPAGNRLKQSLPGQRCNRSLLLRVAERDGFALGDFCPNGNIQKIQAHANISVTATAQNISKTNGSVLSVSYSKEIVETFIYRVSPNPTAPTLLATPNWPQGMKPSSTLSWVVDVPSQYQAQLQFVNVSQPKCLSRHTLMTVQMLDDDDELMSRREYDTGEDKLLVPRSFYLNMSNCIPEAGHFGAVTKVVLQKKSNLLAILLGILGAVLLLLIVLAVVCIVTKKKKKEQERRDASIYMGKGNIFRPNDSHFTKTRSDNESHVYASIDDTMIYGHLLADSSYADSMQDHYNGTQVDSYNTFMGPSDGQMPVIKEPEPEPELGPGLGSDTYNTFLDPADSFLPPRPRTPIDRQDSLGFQDRRMVDNELYTFKTTGDINTIRLSGVDLEPDPPLEEEYL